MKLLPLTLVAVVAVFGVACQKESSVNNTTTVDKVKTYTEAMTVPGAFSYSYTFNVNYDNDGRIKSMVDVTDQSNRYEYTYNSDHFILEIYAGGVLQIHNKLFLNSARTRVDSSMQYNDDMDTSLTKYVYDGKGQLVTQRFYDYTSSTGPVYVGSSKTEFNADGSVSKETDPEGTTTYVYAKEYKRNIYIGAPYFPIQQLLPTQTITKVGGDTETMDYTYTFDAKKRLVTEAGLSDAGNVIMRGYTYY